MSIIVEPSFVEGQKASFVIHLDLSAVGRSVDTSYSGLQNLNLFIYTVTVAVFAFMYSPYILQCMLLCEELFSFKIFCSHSEHAKQPFLAYFVRQFSSWQTSVSLPPFLHLADRMGCIGSIS